MNAPMSTPRICHAEHMPGTVAQDAHVSVLIVGGGACGLTAALMLHDAGVDCAMLERDATPLGSSALSSGFIPAPGTQAQRAAALTTTVRSVLLPTSAPKPRAGWRHTW